jgi:hypothetical protein
MSAGHRARLAQTLAVARAPWYEMRVFLDDERNTPKGWVLVYWPIEVISLLESGQGAEQTDGAPDPTITAFRSGEIRQGA